MKSLAIILLLAAPAVATQPCGKSFCRVNKAVVVKQVHHAHHVYPSAYYVPYGQQAFGSFADQSDVLVAAIETGVDRALERRGIGAARLTATGPSVVLTKCGKCHLSTASNAAAKEAWIFEGVPLNWKDAARAQDGIVNHGMAERAKLTDDEQNSIVGELTSYLTSAVKE